MYKCIRFLFITIIIMLGGGFLSAQSNIDLANKYYDADDYCKFHSLRATCTVF